MFGSQVCSRLRYYFICYSPHQCRHKRDWDHEAGTSLLALVNSSCFPSPYHKITIRLQLQKGLGVHNNTRISHLYSLKKRGGMIRVLEVKHYCACFDNLSRYARLILVPRATWLFFKITFLVALVTAQILFFGGWQIQTVCA